MHQQTDASIQFENGQLLIGCRTLVGRVALAAKDFRTGEPIVEYTGIVRSADESREQRLQIQEETGGDSYFMPLQDSCVIDATKCGNAARYLCHSDNPNSEARQWWNARDSRMHIVFVARKPIGKGDEVTFAYDWNRNAMTAVQCCLCFEAGCSGFIGLSVESVKKCAPSARKCAAHARLLEAVRESDDDGAERILRRYQDRFLSGKKGAYCTCDLKTL